MKLLEKKPEALNLINIYSETSKNTLDEVLKEMSGKEYSYLKKLIDLLVSELTPVGKEIQKLLEDKSHLEHILKKGKKKVILSLRKTLKKYT